MSDSEKDNKDESIKDTPDSRTEDKSETLPETGDIQKGGSGSDERPASGRVPQAAQPKILMRDMIVRRKPSLTIR